MKRCIPGLPGLGPELLAPVRDLEAIPPWLPTGRTLLVTRASNALYLGCRALRLKRGDRILTPAFSCWTVNQPLEAAGAESLFFNVTADFRIDWDHVRRVMNRRVKAMLWYHFLGVSEGFDEVIPFCREHGLYLIEDCAHALFSQYRGRPVGCTGDFAVFSMRKSIPALMAGALVVNNPKLRLPRLPAFRPPGVERQRFLLQSECNFHRLRAQCLDTARPVARVDFRFFFKEVKRLYSDDRRLYAIDEVSRLVMHNADPAAVRAARQRHFRTYLRELKEVALFKRMTPGASPIGFPLLLRDPDAFRARLEREGIETLGYWPAWALPKGVAGRFPEARKLADAQLSMPCHQDLGAEEVKYICAAVKRLL